MSNKTSEIKESDILLDQVQKGLSDYLETKRRYIHLSLYICLIFITI